MVKENELNHKAFVAIHLQSVANVSFL